MSILQGDPSFQELVEHYRKEIGHDGARMRERLVALGVDAADALNERLDEHFRPDGNRMSDSELRKLVELVADRTGFGKKSEQDVNVNVGFADRLNAARERISALAAKRTIEHIPEPIGG